LLPGAQIQEVELAQQLAMSRTPVREALAMLEAEGLVSTNSRRERTITKLDYHDLTQLYVVREALESTAAAEAASHASEMEIAGLQEMLRIEEKILDEPDKLVIHNRHFHEALYLCSHNRYLVRMLEHVGHSLFLLRPMGRVGPERRQTALAEHRAIVQAIEVRDAARAAESVRLHVRRSQEARVKLLMQQG
jgi:DNA-binding GntR family transcriptional regulator